MTDEALSGLRHEPGPTLERRIGTFQVPVADVWNRPDNARAILRDCIVMRCECIDYMHRFEYVAFNPAFRLLDEGEEAPRYFAILEVDIAGNVEVREWQEVRS